MNAFKLLGSVSLALALMGGLSAPATAQSNKKSAAAAADIDFGDNSSEWAQDGECDDPRFEGPGSATELVDADIMKDATDCRAAFLAGSVTLKDGSATVAVNDAAIDFGDDSGAWSKDGECDDPRFAGTGSAAETLESDILKDATDCKAAYDAGTVSYVDDGSGEIPPMKSTIDFGDDSGEWTNDGECDDPRFMGTGSAQETVEADVLKDATDCREAFEAGTVRYLGGDAEIGSNTPPADLVSPSAIEFGDDSSEWAKDGECDDPRFAGTGSAQETLAADILKDATDCEAAYNAGTVSFVGDDVAVTPYDYGDDSSDWANDGECDDPRFAGRGVAETLLDADLGHDATDCRAAVEAGTATFNGVSQGVAAIAEFDYGSDWSKWANDGECDDLRFVGEGTDKKLLTDDLYGDATDCRNLEAEGLVTIRKVYTPEYIAGAPYDSSDIDFGDNSSDYADDDRCDDPRFEGPGTATLLLDSDLERDSADCKAAYEAGTIVLVGDA